MMRAVSRRIKIRIQSTLKNQFARLLGLIPEDSVRFDGSGSHLLWDAYRNILEMANLAESDFERRRKD
jgi:hypothetical protein